MSSRRATSIARIVRRAKNSKSKKARQSELRKSPPSDVFRIMHDVSKNIGLQEMIGVERINKIYDRIIIESSSRLAPIGIELVRNRVLKTRNNSEFIAAIATS